MFFAFNFFSFAQTEKTDIKRQLDGIYKDFNKINSELYVKYLDKYKPLYGTQKNEAEKKAFDSLYKLDYSKYYEELRPYLKVKVENLKELLKKLNDENPLIGRTTLYNTDKPEEVQKINEAKNNPDYSDFKFIGITKNEETDLLVNKENIKTIRTDFSNNFDSSFFDDSGETTLSAKISFVLDNDGYIKKLKPIEGSAEFGYFCAITLYEIHKKYEPSLYKGNPVLTRYALPIKMQFD